MQNFCPKFTPLDVPTLTTFDVRGRTYVVDVLGALFQLMTEGDDPDLWCWQLVIEL